MRYLGTKDEAADFATQGDGTGGGVTDHGMLTGLADDDHPQYLTQARGDARYVQPLTGEIKMWPTAVAPSGYLLCDGSTFSSATYPALAALLGDTFGVHSGTTYYLPNFTSRFPRGGTPGGTGGSSTKTLTAANLPVHTHGINHDHGTTASGGLHRHNIQLHSTTGGGVASVPKGSNSPDAGDFVNPIKDTSSSHSHDVPAYTGVSGDGSAQGLSGSAFDVTNPYLNISFIIKAA